VVKTKIEESNCAVFCIQETKRPTKFAPKRFNKFAFHPCEGASGGIFIALNENLLAGNVIHSSKFAITVHFSSAHNAEQWKLTTIYGPCHGQDRMEFINWLNNIQISDQENWMFIGDFNFHRSLENKNREGGNMHDVMIFNEVISNLALQEIPLKGRSYT
jgi:hypothetical protein